MQNFSYSSSLELTSDSQWQVEKNQNITNIIKNIYIEEEKSRISMRFNELKIPVENNFILLQSLINILKEQMKYTLSEGFLIYVYNDLKGNYLYMGSDPLLFPIKLSVNEFRNSSQIYLKFHSTDIIKKKIKRQMRNEKRLKERGIEAVLNLVAKWRNTYNNMNRKINLQQIASDMNISRKTLDDYSLVIRKAEQYGFDFEKNKHKKMGFLRSFVRFHIQQEKINIKTLPQYITIEQNINQTINQNEYSTYNTQLQDQMKIEKNHSDQQETEYIQNKQFEQHDDGNIDIFFNLQFSDINQF